MRTSTGRGGSTSWPPRRSAMPATAPTSPPLSRRKRPSGADPLGRRGGAAVVPRRDEGARGAGGRPSRGGRRGRRVHRDRDRRRDGGSRVVGDVPRGVGLPHRQLRAVGSPGPRRAPVGSRARDRNVRGPRDSAVERAVAVGGSATSLRRVVGAELSTTRSSAGSGSSAPRRSTTWRAVSSSTRAECAFSRPGSWCSRRSAIALGHALTIGGGGLREGVIIEMVAAAEAA